MSTEADDSGQKCVCVEAGGDGEIAGEEGQATKRMKMS